MFQYTFIIIYLQCLDFLSINFDLYIFINSISISIDWIRIDRQPWSEDTIYTNYFSKEIIASMLWWIQYEFILY